MFPPKANKISSEFESFWKSFVRIFQVLSVSHYSIFRPNIRSNFFGSLPFLVYFICFSSIIISSVVLTSGKALLPRRNDTEIRLSKHGKSLLMYYVNSLSIIGSMVVHIAIHVEALFCRKQEEKIFKKLKLIDDIFVKELNYMTDYRKRRAKYIRQNIGVSVLSVILAAASSFISVSHVDEGVRVHFMKPIHIIPVFVIRNRWCYVSMFLSAIADTLEDLQYALQKQQLRSFRETRLGPMINCTTEKMRYFREIYSNSCQIVTLIDDCFGWTLITFLIQFTFDSIDASYWLYMNLHFFGSNSLNIRKALTLQEFISMEKSTLFYLFSNVSDIILYSSSLLLMFWYFCMLSERCQKMVN